MDQDTSAVRPIGRGSPSAALALWTGAVAVVAIGLTYAFGVLHDYGAYLVQWANLLDGADPWSVTRNGEPIPRNAYGPAHAVVGYLAGIHYLAPKALFALCNVAIFALLANAALRAGWTLGAREAVGLALAYAFFPLPLLLTYGFGLNDSFVALCVVLAFEARRRLAYGWAGTVLALGALMKFYPLLFVPFLMSGQRGTFHLRGLAVGFAVFAAGMGAAYAIWGESILTPFAFGDDRGAKMLSLLRFLEAADAHVGAERLVAWLLDKNSLMVVGIAALVSLHGWLARLDWRITGLVGILAVFFVYKVGHQQFYLCWVAALAWVLVDAPSDEVRAVARRLVPVALFLGLFQIVYFASGQLPGAEYYLSGSWAVLRPVVSVPFAAVVVWCLVSAKGGIFRPWQRSVRLRW